MHDPDPGIFNRISTTAGSAALADICCFASASLTMVNMCFLELFAHFIAGLPVLFYFLCVYQSD